MNLEGQWIGSFTGSPGGFATLNVEKNSSNHPFVCLVQGDGVPGTRIDLELTTNGSKVSLRSTRTRVWDTSIQALVEVDDYRKRAKSEVKFSDLIKGEGTISGDKLRGEWSGDAGVAGEFTFSNPLRDKAQQADTTMKWRDYRNFVGELLESGMSLIFRGHESSEYRLQSSLHRLGRYDLIRYEQESCPDLVQHVNAVSSEEYDLRNPNQFGALISLAQHHGFPSPLLDWTRSPYIAAFFAFQSRPKLGPVDGRSRIYALDNGWQRETLQSANLADPSPVVSVREFPARNNPRHLPQQSIHTFVNVEDVEAWIRLIERAQGKKYLTVIDLPWSERKLAMRELEFMGVNAASMFPGLDGVCRALKERHFDW